MDESSYILLGQYKGLYFGIYIQSMSRVASVVDKVIGSVGKGGGEGTSNVRYGGDCGLEVAGVACHKQTNDETEEAKDTTKDFDNENLDEEIRVCGICQCCGGAGDSYANAAKEVAHADSKAAPEQRKTCEIVAARVKDVVGNIGKLS